MALRRRLAVGAAIAIGLCAVVAVAGLPLYVFPPQAQIPSDADLIYVIGPPRSPRIETAELLRADGVARDVLVSVAAVPRPDAGDITAADVPICGEADVTCESPAPFTTAGETRMLTDYARDHPAADTVVLTFTPHVARTRYLFAKCYGGKVTVVGVDEHLNLGDWIYQYAYQTAAFVKAWFEPCPGT
ncbi:YdcF family protein [Microbacterium sp. X-17]|uniref:YdcF family protein n=1 Tax=Microbacterium sp. X-17 TaxID=3144404 RepID=UPI0031F5BAD5